MIGVVCESNGKLVGVFADAQFADAFITGLHQEQMRVVGHVQMPYATVYLDPGRGWSGWLAQCKNRRGIVVQK